MAVSSDMKDWDVAVVGEIYADHVFSGFGAWPQPGEEALARDYARELGGGAVNTACGLARLGRRTRLFGCIGEADFDWFAARLQGFGVAADGLQCSVAGTGITVSVSMPDDRSFFTYRGANDALPAWLLRPETLAALASARHVHFAMPLPRAVAAAVLPRLRALGCTTSLDVGFSPDWLADPQQRATLHELDYFLPNRREAELLTGGTTPAAFADWMRQQGLSPAVIKLGAAGAMAIDGRQLLSVPCPTVLARDTTGAGDAFDAGFIDGVLDAAPLETCLRRGCVSGSLCTTELGALAGLADSLSQRTTYELTYGP
jgi:sugar/nucleoside kinase (ribokinase family)